MIRRNPLKKSAALALALAAGLLVNGCYLRADGQDLERRLDQLNARQAQIEETTETQSSELQLLVTEASGQVSALREALQEARGMLTRLNANLGTEVEGLSQRVAEIGGELEQLEFALDELRVESGATDEDLQMQLDALLNE